MNLEKTKHIKLDLDLIRNHIKINDHNFYCPFSVETSYLSLLDSDDPLFNKENCTIMFLDLQDLDYINEPSRSARLYMLGIMRHMKKSNNIDGYKFIKSNLTRFAAECDEDNYVKPTNDKSAVDIINMVESKFGKVCRARITRISPGGVLNTHKDETSINNMRVVCPVISDDKCISKFKFGDDITSEYLQADGYCYSFDSSSIEHSVHNNSKEYRYAIIFTVLSNKTLLDHDKFSV